LRGVEERAKSIEQLGLLINPVTVTQDLTLVAGHRRLEACKLLGWETIPAHIVSLDEVTASLAEIDENLQREELNALEPAEQAAERKQLYLVKYPETRPVKERGGPGRGKKTNDKLSPVSFAEDTATKTGKDRRTVQREAQIGENITQEARDLVRDTPVAENQ